MSFSAHWRVAALVFLTTLVFAPPALAQRGLGTVTLAWDPNPEPQVTGYFVYVSRTSDTSPTRLDAGPATQFMYRGILPGVGYTFTVAAYTEEGTVGPQSESVYFFAGAAIETGRILALPAAAQSAEVSERVGESPSVRSTAPMASRAAPAAMMLCAGDSSTCYRADAVTALGDATITSLAPLPDGRVVVVEESRRLYIVDEDGSKTSALALGASASNEIVAVAVDPAFPETRTIFLAIAEQLGASRRVSVVRYRELGGSLGQAATLVTDVPVPGRGSLALAVDDHRRVYLAVPAADGTLRSDATYAARVLRFEADGTASGNASASPVFSQGFEQPAALFWDARDNAVWLSGGGGQSRQPFARIGLGKDGTVPEPDAGRTATGFENDAVLTAFASDLHGGETMLTTDSTAGELYELSVRNRHAQLIQLPEGLQATLVAGTVGTNTFVVVRDVAASSYTLLRLSRTR